MRLKLLIATLSIAIAAAPASALDIQFDYSLDRNGFFNGSEGTKRKQVLENVAQFFEGILTDQLDAIVPSASNTWTALIFDPANINADKEIANPSIPSGVMVIYAGGSALDGLTLAVGGSGGFSARGTQAWLDLLEFRGQGGAPSDDYGPWGGSISFDTDTVWYAEPNGGGPSASSNQVDFYSTALHEIGHVLGFGLADSWEGRIRGSTFIGTSAVAAFGGPVPTSPGHWADGTMSKIYPAGAAQVACMNPSTEGLREVFTDLDVAGLDDIGWTIRSVTSGSAGGQRDTSHDHDRGLTGCALGSGFGFIAVVMLFGLRRRLR